MHVSNLTTWLLDGHQFAQVTIVPWKTACCKQVWQNGHSISNLHLITLVIQDECRISHCRAFQQEVVTCRNELLLGA